MFKALYPLLAALALLLAAIAGGWSAAPPGPFAFEWQHATSHDPTSVNDDDGDREEDGVECSMVAPPRADDDDQDDQDDADADADGDGDALRPTARSPRFPPVLDAASSSMTRWGLRPSGEHRDAADRPPRA